jgi:formate dehydrogenase assembly factor FdhD
MKVVINASHHIEVLTKGPNPEVGKDEENTVTNGCSSCGRGSAQEKNKKCAKWQPRHHKIQVSLCRYGLPILHKWLSKIL